MINWFISLILDATDDRGVGSVPCVWSYGLQKKNTMTSDAVMARRNFIFSFDILTIGERERDRERGNLHNFQAHIKLRSVVFFKGAKGSRHTQPNQHFKVFMEPLTFVADHREVDWQDSFTLFRNLQLVLSWKERERGRERSPFTRLKYNLLFRALPREEVKKYIVWRSWYKINKRLCYISVCMCAVEQEEHRCCR